MQLNPFGIPLILSSIIMLAAAKRVWSLGSSRGERPFAFLLAAGAIYSTAYVMEISSASLDLILFWIKIEYFGTASIPALFILFSLHFTGRANKLSNYSLAALFIIPVITLILVFTVEHHDLFYQDIYLNMEGLFPILGFNMGPWYLVHVSYIIFGILFSNLLLLQLWLNTNPVHRKQISIVLVGSMIPWLGFIFYLSRLGPWSIDFMPYFISAGSIIIAWGLVRHGLFELVPIARSKLFEELPDGALIVDPKMRIIDLNIAAQHYLHLTQADIGKLIKISLARFPELVEAIYSNSDQADLEIKIDRVKQSEEDKEIIKPTWLKANIISIQNEGPVIDGQMIIIRDVTERKQFEEKLYYLSTTDELTGLYNRRYFIRIAEDELERAKRYQKYFSIIMMDIDHFKTINDTYGHSAGDKVLKSLGLLLLNRLRKNDTTARLGGEEFGVILPETNLDQAYIAAEQIRNKVVSSPVEYEGQEINYNLSAGVASYSSSTNSLEDILREADRALYQAKEKGRNMSVKADQ